MSDDNNRLVQRLKEEQMNHFLIIETMQRAGEKIDELMIENRRLRVELARIYHLFEGARGY